MAKNLSAFLIALALAGAEPALPADASREEKPGQPASAEASRRATFLVTHQTAQTPEAKAQAVQLLRGLKEKESLRLLVGMLGDTNDAVRLSACSIMAETADAEGYFVKPLTGLLWDKEPKIRIAAAQALSAAEIKSGAVKALAYKLTEAAGANPKDPKNKDIGMVVDAYNQALERLTGKKSDKPDARGQGAFWMDFWKANVDNLEAADSKKLGSDQPPASREGLPRDSLDNPPKK